MFKKITSIGITTILLLFGVCCQAQITSLYKSDSIRLPLQAYTQGTLSIKDSSWYEKHIDTIKTDFVIIVDSNNFVKKVRCNFIVHKYEQEQHSGYGLWNNRNKNDTFLLNNTPVEVLLYRPKGEQMLIGNSQ
jgi:hypothetical protein